MPGFDEDKINLSSTEYAIAGGASGAFTRFFCQPLDVIKVRFQLQVEPISKKVIGSKYSTNTQAAKSIFLEEGLLALWKGHNAGQLLSITYGLVQFQSFEWLTKASYQYLELDSQSPNIHFLCGSLAGAAASVASFPFDVVKTRFIAQGRDKVYETMPHAFSSMVKKEGIKSLFKGLTPALLLVAPQAGAMFTAHRILLSILDDFNWLPPNKVPTLTQNLYVGSLAGLISKFIVYPLDLSRKRLQLQGFEDGRKGFGENLTCRGMVNCILLTMRKEGIKGLYKGLSPSSFKAAITTALHFTGYDLICQFFTRMRKRKLKKQQV